MKNNNINKICAGIISFLAFSKIGFAAANPAQQGIHALGIPWSSEENETLLSAKFNPKNASLSKTEISQSIPQELSSKGFPPRRSQKAFRVRLSGVNTFLNQNPELEELGVVLFAPESQRAADVYKEKLNRLCMELPDWDRGTVGAALQCIVEAPATATASSIAVQLITGLPPRRERAEKRETSKKN